MNNLTIGVTTVSFSSDFNLIKKIEEKTGSKVLINELKKRFTKAELIAFLQQCDACIIGLDQIDESVLKKCPKLKVISKYGVGLDNINFPDCEKYGVRVVYPKGVNKRSVSEQVLGTMLSMARNIFKNANRLKKGRWDKNGGFQLTGKTVGIIGVGFTGKDLIEVLKPFNCRILVNDIIDQSEYYKKNNLIECSKKKIYKEADFISLHTPLTESTRYIINKETLSMMKSTVYILNVARGGIINQKDLKEALLNGVIAGAAIDAYEVEPPDDQELVQLENFIGTPHIGGNAQEAVDAMGNAAIDNLIASFKN